MGGGQPLYTVMGACCGEMLFFWWQDDVNAFPIPLRPGMLVDPRRDAFVPGDVT